MVDTTAAIAYRALALNSATVSPSPLVGGGIDGILVETAELSDVDVIQYVEKRALADGMDAGDVFLGGRTLSLAGMVYGTTRGRLFDLVRSLRRVMSATSAFAEDSANKGFLPFTFSIPTNDVTNYPGRVIPLKLYVIPRTLRVTINRDRIGGVDGDPLGVPWSASLVARDPAIYGATAVSFTVPANGGATTWVNRGDFVAAPTISLAVGAGAGTVVVKFGSSTMTLTVPSGASNRILLYNGATKLLTLDGVLRLDLLALSPSSHPKVALGSSVVSVLQTGSATVVSGTASFTEMYA